MGGPVHSHHSCCFGRVQVSVKMLMNNQTYKDVVQTTKSKLAAKGQRAGGNVDPQNCTAEDTLTLEQYITLMKHLQKSDQLEEIRDRSIFAFLYASVGRADEGRMIFLADVVRPRQMKCIGNSHRQSAGMSCPPPAAPDMCIHVSFQIMQSVLCIMLRPGNQSRLMPRHFHCD